MRQLNRFVGRFGERERSFTEAQIMKFTRPRDQDSFTSRAHSDSNFVENANLVDAVAIVEPEPQRAVAKGALA